MLTHILAQSLALGAPVYIYISVTVSRLLSRVDLIVGEGNEGYDTDFVAFLRLCLVHGVSVLILAGLLKHHAGFFCSSRTHAALRVIIREFMIHASYVTPKLCQKKKRKCGACTSSPR